MGKYFIGAEQHRHFLRCHLGFTLTQRYFFQLKGLSVEQFRMIHRHNIGYRRMSFSPHATRKHSLFEFVQGMQKVIRAKGHHQIYLCAVVGLCRRLLPRVGFL